MANDAPIAARHGDATREALIKAAIDVFGHSGFSGASTRAIAAAAGVNQALIGYHFRGKPGLYLAALEHIAAAVQQRIGPIVTAIEAELHIDEGMSRSPEAGDGRADSQQCLAALHRLCDGFVAMLTSDESAAWARLVLREQQDPSEGFDVLYNGFMSRVLGVITTLIGRIRNTDPAAVETRLTALTIVGQALVFRAARTTVTRQMDWQTVGRDEVTAIQAAVRRNVTAILTQEIQR